MTHNKIYGKTIEFEADSITFDGPLTLPITDGHTDPFTITDAHFLQLTCTNAAGSARTDVGTALIITFIKLNTRVIADFQFGNLRNSANAVAAAPMTFNELVPAEYRPANFGCRVHCDVVDNAAAGTGEVIIDTDGSIQVSPGLVLGNFTNGAACQVLQHPNLIYGTVA